MFDPTLTIESGIERVGEILTIRALDLPPDDPIFDRMKKTSHAWQVLFDNDALCPGRGGTTELNTKGRLRNEFLTLWQDYIAVPEPFDEVYVRLGALSSQFLSYNYHTLDLHREAIMNGLEHGAGAGLWIHSVLGRKGEFMIIGQGTQGPSLESALGRSSLSFLYLSGKRPRGCGFSLFARPQSNIWYSVDPAEYRLHVFSSGDIFEDKSAAPPLSFKAPKWKPLWGTPDRRLWDSLVNCEAGTADPREYYADFFASDGLSLDEALAQMDPRVRELFEINVRGFLGLED